MRLFETNGYQRAVTVFRGAYEQVGNTVALWTDENSLPAPGRTAFSKMHRFPNSKHNCKTPVSAFSIRPHSYPSAGR